MFRMNEETTFTSLSMSEFFRHKVLGEAPAACDLADNAGGSRLGRGRHPPQPHELEERALPLNQVLEKLKVSEESAARVRADSLRAARCGYPGGA